MRFRSGPSGDGNFAAVCWVHPTLHLVLVYLWKHHAGQALCCWRCHPAAISASLGPHLNQSRPRDPSCCLGAAVALDQANPSCGDPALGAPWVFARSLSHCAASRSGLSFELGDSCGSLSRCAPLPSPVPLPSAPGTSRSGSSWWPMGARRFRPRLVRSSPRNFVD